MYLQGHPVRAWRPCSLIDAWESSCSSSKGRCCCLCVTFVLCSFRFGFRLGWVGGFPFCVRGAYALPCPAANKEKKWVCVHKYLVHVAINISAQVRLKIPQSPQTLSRSINGTSIFRCERRVYTTRITRYSATGIAYIRLCCQSC